MSAASPIGRLGNAVRGARRPGAATPPPTPPTTPTADPELIGQRDRLVERFAVMQSDLGGAFYEMAVRDHVRLDVLTRKAAELQRVDEEIAQLERKLELQRTGLAGSCPKCGAGHGPGAAFCSQCGTSLGQRATA